MNYPQDPGQRPAPGYPGYPPPNPFSAPPVPEHELVAPRRPGTVEAAFWIAVVLPVLSTVLSAMSYLFLQGWLRAEIFSGPSPDELNDEVNQTVNSVMLAILAVAIVFFVILTVLWIVFGFKMRAGHNWARVTLLILGGMWALASLSSLASHILGTGLDADLPMPSGYSVLSYGQNGIEVLGMIAFAVLVLAKPSNDYFQAFQRRY